MSKAHLVVLGFVNRKPMYGYEIIQIIVKKKLNIWANIKLPSIYKAMQVLEEKGYLLGKQETEGNNPPRTVYSLTESGKEYYNKVLLSFIEESSEQHHQFWFALSLLDKELSKKDFLKILWNRLQFIERIIDKHKCEEMRPVGFKDIDNPPFVYKHMLKLGDNIIKTELEVLKDLIKDAEENYDTFRGKE